MSDECQKFRGIVKVRQRVKLHQLFNGTALKNQLDRSHRIDDLFHFDTVAESDVRAGSGVKHDTGRVQQFDVLVQMNFLHRFGEARRRSHSHSSGAFERIDQTGFPDVGISNDAHDN